MKKLFFFLVLFLAFAVSVKAEIIHNFNAEITINEDGTINVQEKIQYDFEEAQRHGIYRTIPSIKTNSDGKKFKLDFFDFSVVDENNAPYRFIQTKEGSDIKLKIGDPDKTITGMHTYVIRYKVAGALTYFSDHDELYWNVTGNEWPAPIISVVAKVILPKSLKQEEIDGKCYVGRYGSTATDCIVQKDKNIITFSSLLILKPHDGLTIAVRFPIDIVAHLEPKEFVSFWETALGKLVIVLIGLIILIWYFILPFYIIYRWYKIGRDPKGTVGVTTAWYYPPRLENGRLLTPGEVGTLGDETVDLKDISATIVDLARRGYLKIVEKNKGDFYLVRQAKEDKNSELLEYEKILLDQFFKSKTELRLKNSDLFQEVEMIKKSLYQQTVADGLFAQDPQSIRTRYYILALIALFTGNFFLALVAFIFGRVMPRKTVVGVNAFNVARSLKNFLSSQERQLTFQADKQMMFEKLLPYAIVFGVEKIWAKRFVGLNLKPPDWYQGYSSTRFNSYVFVNSLNSSIASFRSAATPTRSSSGFSSGFSGGSSGGGGGGGGGGSW